MVLWFLYVLVIFGSHVEMSWISRVASFLDGLKTAKKLIGIFLGYQSETMLLIAVEARSGTILQPM